jgi:acyl-CoA thioesterase
VVVVADLVGALSLEEVGPDRYRAGHVLENGAGVVFGGQLLAQSVAAALTGVEGKTVKTLHTVFARAASPEGPLDIAVDRMHTGRAFASSTVTFTQGDRVCARSQVLLTAPDESVMDHADPAPAVALPPADGGHDGEWQIHIVGDVDVRDPTATGPPELDVWTRFPGAPDDPVSNQALVSFATDPFVIGAAMRPHEGVGQSQAHVTLSTGVITQTLTFHEPCAAGEWFLMAHRSPYAGHGRVYGRADVFQDDTLVASFVQDAMVRPMPDRGAKL